MKTTDLFKTSSTKLNESLEKTFGKKIDFSTFDIPKLEDARNKLRTQVHQVRNSSGFNENMENDAYYEAQWMLNAINAELAEREELLATGGTAEVEEVENEGFGSVEDEVLKLFKDFDRTAAEEENIYGDPDIDKAMEYVRAGKLEAAAEEIVNAYTDQDGGEPRNADGLYDDLLGDLQYVVSDGGDTDAHEGWWDDAKDAIAKAGEHPAVKAVADVGTKIGTAMGKIADPTGVSRSEKGSEKWKNPDKDSHGSGWSNPDGNADGPTPGYKDSAVKTQPLKNDAAGHDNMGFSDKQIKMAYGILNDMRYKGGNLTAAVEKIEQIAPGLSDHPGVQRAIRATSESIQTGEEMKHITEGEIQQASAIVTAKTMVDRISRFIEELSSMENETLLQLGDSIRDEIGQEQAKGFIESSAPAIQQALETLKGTRDTLSSSVNTLATGEAPADMLGAEPEAGAETDMAEPAAPDAMNAEEPAGDDFGAAEPAAGGIEAAGREQRESINYQNKLLKVLAG